MFKGIYFLTLKEKVNKMNIEELQEKIAKAIEVIDEIGLDKSQLPREVWKARNSLFTAYEGLNKSKIDRDRRKAKNA